MPKIIDSLKSLKKILKEYGPSKICLVTSKDLKDKLDWAIKEINIPDLKIVLIPNGEESKTWNELQKLLKKFSELNLDRDSIVLALGGGTIGDTAGFAASIFLRGIKYVQIPTTLLSQVDSAHGGKTGINFLNYKNQIGTFHLPIAIVVDIRFIKSLGREQIIDGLGEIIKAGFIKDVDILNLLKKEKVDSLSKSKNLKTIIEKSIKVKEFFTSKDFRDGKERQFLNVGHTIGHAIELKYKVSHGKSVIIGMIQELSITEKLGMTDPGVKSNLLNLLKTLGIDLETNLKADYKTIIHDKKVTGSKIILPIIEKEGKVKSIILDLKKIKV